VTALERLHGGDVATVAVQYAEAPSWVSYLRGGEGVQQSVRALVEAVHAEVLRLPAQHRPQVLVYGESLGAWGGLNAYPSSAALLQRVDGALWAGVPAGAREEAASPGPVQIVVHPDDPVPAWTTSLLLHPIPQWQHRWFPVVSFWQVTGDVIAADSTPLGHGHRYGPELAQAWQQLSPVITPPLARPEPQPVPRPVAQPVTMPPAGSAPSTPAAPRSAQPA
jgi:uncharacterized membrane protein